MQTDRSKRAHRIDPDPLAEPGWDSRTVAALHLGRMEYDAALDLQRHIQKRIIDNKLDGNPRQIPNVFLSVEHPPVFTLGKSGDAAHLLATDEILEGLGATFVETDRGGDITFHGPGQLVGYPLLDLDRFFTDIGRYLRTLEEVIIRTCTSYGLEAGRVAGRTGVWIDAGKASERKICAMGIRCSRWVTMHGFALNVNTDLAFFDRIVPCGISDRGVTSLAAELGHAVDDRECRERVRSHFSEEFAAPIFEVSDVEHLRAILD